MNAFARPSALGSRYILTELIGRGATGEVWRATDVTTGRPVAAKVLKEHHSADPALLARFVQERNVLLGLDHPQVVKVRDLVVEGTTLAIVMDLVEGPSLSALLASRGTLSPGEAVELTIGILQALATAHSQGIVHRDIKTDNVLLAASGPLDRHCVRLVDFGIAKILEDSPGAREAIGTPKYMAPELFAYGTAFETSDVYSVGIVLYQLLAGRTPFGGMGGPTAVGIRHIESLPPVLPVDGALWRLLSGMLAKNPVHRLPAAELVTAFCNLPLSVWQAPALPVQPDVTGWEKSPLTIPGREEIEALSRGKAEPAEQPSPPQPGPAAETAEEDPDQTSLNDWRPLPKRAETAPTQAEPAESEQAGDATLLKSAALPAPESAPKTAPEKKSRKPLYLLLGAAAGVVALSFGALALTGQLSDGQKEAASPEITTQAAQLVGDFTESGLRVDLGAAWDKEVSTTRLTLTSSVAPGASLSGEMLVVIPDVDGGCAQVEEQEGLTRVKASTDGLNVPCGYYFDLERLTAGQKQEVTISVGLKLVGEDSKVLDSYEDWLRDVQRETGDALASMTGTRFALQRVTGISVTATSVSLEGTAATPVPYLVKAKWRGKHDAALETDLLSSDTLDGMEVDALLDLTGGDGLDAVSLTTCSSARVIGTRVLAEQPDNNCFVEIELGVMKSPRASFQARMKNASSAL
ncbi:protein kinase [Buchananella felis]|uniref:serine/threonine-protein kinase n=1 Tax=Buchananella felis TaxID=3231492 RepID=UPI00352711EC